MPNDPVEPPGKISRDAAAPVYDVQLSASARSRPVPFTSDASAPTLLSWSAWIGPGFTASSVHPDSAAVRTTAAVARAMVEEFVMRVIGVSS